MTQKSRRTFLKQLAVVSGAGWLTSSLLGCTSQMSLPANTAKLEFLHGVASGDPQQDRLILWTRVSPEPLTDNVSLLLEVSTNPDMQPLVHSELVLAKAANDYCVKVDLAGLTPATDYYYRFRDQNSSSVIGHGRTLATQRPESVRMAVLSCSNYPAGYFHAYKEVARQPLDAVLHLGDYLYEYAMGEYGTEQAKALGRELAADNSKEMLSLADYRKRYALYRADTDLQAAHQAHSFICVWDDHEITNDAWTDGAENHQPEEGSYQGRKLAALQAYYEWMPIRPLVSGQQQSLARRFDFGDLVSLYMLDTRIEGRMQQLDYASFSDADQGLDSDSFLRALQEPTRTLLGPQQQSWLLQQLLSSKASYQVLGQQVLMAKMWLPAQALAALGKPGPELAAQLHQLAQQVKAGQKLLPYNLDAWDGYPAERELIYQAAMKTGQPLLVLAGDTHNAWASSLHSGNGNKVGVELATASVTSSGIEDYLKLDSTALRQLEQDLVQLIDELDWCNLEQRGYLLLNFTASQLTAQWFGLDTVKAARYQNQLLHELKFSPALTKI
ncbi:alkaline phosphatase D family protein [Rheinheimera sp.]|uniref:alkaline phosphatase D family protein n=1 Tax=Rheinheimera sp. TaxID=1869214 RepID=UPI00307E805B